jgi:DUF2971 family protein
MLLHRYFGSHAFETLKEAKLKTSRLSSFNDPFEFMYVYAASMTFEQAKRYILSKCKDPAFLSWVKQKLPMATEIQIQNHMMLLPPDKIADVAANFGKKCELSYARRREIIDEELRAVCFSNSEKVEILDEILLWSHYANKHEGMRIGFEFPNEANAAFEITEITYQKERVKVDFSFEAQFEALEKAFSESAITKSLAWKYEWEVRLFTKTGCCEPREIKTKTLTMLEHFLPFDSSWVKTVDFGALCPIDKILEVINFLKANHPHVICRKADFHKTEYALEYKEIGGV